MFLKRVGLERTEYSILLGFALFSLWGVFSHEMWRDELQAWSLARDSNSLFELYQNIYHEGHPVLWYLVLFILRHITHNPGIMQGVHWAISVLMVAMLLRYSPFPIHWKYLTAFSYFWIYEYTVISRNYNLAVLLAFIFCTIHAQYKQRFWLICIVLVSLANTNAYGLLLSLILFVFLLLEAREKHTALSFLVSSIYSKAGLAFLAYGWLLASYQISRVKSDVILQKLLSILAALNSHISVSAAVLYPFSSLNQELPINSGVIRNFIASINSIWHAYVPLPPLFQLDFWGRNVLEDGWLSVTEGDIGSLGYVSAIKLLLSIVLFVWFAFIFRQRRSVFWTYLIGNGILIVFQAAIFNGHSLRHEGFFLVLLVICAWLYLDLQKEDYFLTPKRIYHKTNKLFVTSFTAILFLQMGVGLYALAIDYEYPFSAGKAAAEFLVENNLENASILGSRYRQVSVISGYLDVPIYYLERKERGTFTFDAPPELTNESEVFQAIETAIAELPKQTHVLVMSRPLNLYRESDLDIQLLAAFTQAIEPSEKFYIYSARHLSSPYTHSES